MLLRRPIFRITLAASILLGGATASADTITIEADHWFPYNGTPNTANEGYMIDLLREIVSQSGDRIEYRLMDWDSAVPRALAGQVDCVVGAYIEDTPDHAMTSEPWGFSGNAFLAHADRIPRLNNLEDFKQLRIGAVENYSYGERIDAILEEPGVKVTRQRSSRQAFPHLVMKLITNNIDIIVEDKNVASAALNELSMRDRILILRDDLTEPDGVHVACTPNARGRALVQRFDEGLKAARASGRLAQILAKYGLEDWVN